jgi:hypothetical protein
MNMYAIYLDVWTFGCQSRNEIWTKNSLSGHETGAVKTHTPRNGGKKNVKWLLASKHAFLRYGP